MESAGQHHVVGMIRLFNTNSRSGPKCGSIGFAHDEYVGGETQPTLLRSPTGGSWFPYAPRGCPRSHRSAHSRDGRRIDWNPARVLTADFRLRTTPHRGVVTNRVAAVELADPCSLL